MTEYQSDDVENGIYTWLDKVLGYGAWQASKATEDIMQMIDEERETRIVNQFETKSNN